MAKNTPVPRSDKFNWDSKKNLYDYFQEKGNLAKHAIDREIELAMEEFKLRQGQPIDPRELWQKVGIGLAKKFGDLGGILYKDQAEPKSLPATADPEIDFLDAITPETVEKKLEPIKPPEEPPKKRAPVAIEEAVAEEEVLELSSMPSDDASPIQEDTSTYKPARKAATEADEELVDSDEEKEPGFFARIFSLFAKKDSDMELDEDFDSVDAHDTEKEAPIEELPALDELELEMAETKIDTSRGPILGSVGSSDLKAKKPEAAVAPASQDDDEPVFEAKS